MIPLTRPDLTFSEVAPGIEAVLSSGTLTRGPWVRRFEALCSAYVGTRFAFATTSATTALHLALVAAGIGPGDEVLLSDFTYPATGNVVVHLGAVPVLVDSGPDHFGLDPEDLQRKITARTRAIMPVDPFGAPAELETLERLAAERDLVLIEDAATSLGATLNGRRCGAFGSAGCFSFHPRKSITTGEGGMITTDDPELAERIELLRNHGGRAGERGITFEAAGFNYRLNELQAVLGVAQMERLEEILAARARVAALYDTCLSELPLVSRPAGPARSRVTHQSYVVVLAPSLDRDRIIRRMRDGGVETTLGTYALHAQPAFARCGYGPGDLPHAWRYYRQALTLPLYGAMGEETVGLVVERLRAAIAEQDRIAPGAKRSL